MLWFQLQKINHLGTSGLAAELVVVRRAPAGAGTEIQAARPVGLLDTKSWRCCAAPLSHARLGLSGQPSFFSLGLKPAEEICNDFFGSLYVCI